MIRHRPLFLLVVFACSSAVWSQGKPSPWAAAIASFEKADQEKPTAPCGIVFVGSSSIRLWELDVSFPGLPVLNRGFGGSQLADSAEYCEQLVLKHRPKVVVVYAGDNDLAHGKTPEQVRDDLSAFLAQVRRQLPETRVVFLSIKPSISRWSLIDKQRRTNDLCRVLLERDPLAMFLDVGSVLLDDKGMPDPGYFLADGLHLNARGYERWAEILRPVLVKSMEG